MVLTERRGKTMTLFDKIKNMNEEEMKDFILKVINWVTPPKREVANNSDLVIDKLRKECK